jgi:hypothetical protein
MKSDQAKKFGRTALQSFLSPVLFAPPRLSGSNPTNYKPEANRKQIGSKSEANRKQIGSISEAFRKHFGSISEARNSLFLEENQQSSFRCKKKIEARRFSMGAPRWTIHSATPLLTRRASTTGN